MAASKNSSTQQIRDWDTRLLRLQFKLKKKEAKSSYGSQTLRALIVGINHYLFHRNMHGSVPDAHRMDEYFRTFVSQSESLTGYYPQLLLDEEATRNNIIDSFNDHLIEQANEGDFVVFYFSGHGGQERAHPALNGYTNDGLLNGLICHDSGREGMWPIADIEIRYLLHKLSQKKCEIIIIIEASHSI